MSYTNVYPSRINWENYPAVTTPIDEVNLNKIDYAVYVHDQTLANWDTTKAQQSDLLLSVKSIDYDTETGTFVFTWQNGTTKIVDLNIEKIPVSFSMSAQGVITMTTEDGTSYTADVGALIKTYTFTDSSEIDFTVTTDQSGNKTVTAGIVAGSIAGSKLESNFLANCQAAQSAAEAAQGFAEDSAEDSEAWAVGTRDGSPVPSTDPAYNNNSKYWAEHTSSSFAGLTDTSFSNLQNGQIPVYNSSTSKWENGSAQSGGVTSFNSRTGDVTPAVHDYDADQVDYNNSTSGLTATDAQAAIDEVNTTAEKALGVMTSGVSASVGAEYVDITNAAISSSKILTPYFSNTSGDAIGYNNITVTSTTARITFGKALEEATTVYLKIEEV